MARVRSIDWPPPWPKTTRLVEPGHRPLLLRRVSALLCLSQLINKYGAYLGCTQGPPMAFCLHSLKQTFLSELRGGTK
jgi:hypothetical protein